MRGTGWLLLLAILAILAGIGITYRTQQRVLQKEAPKKPEMLPNEISGLRDDFVWTRRAGGRDIAEIHARKLRQEKDSNQVHLEQVELKIFNKAGDEYNLVKSANADFNEKDSLLYSEGEVEITLRVPVEGEPARTLVKIKSSGVNFEVKTGKASTDRPANFTFENGTGKSVGASYDPTARELHLRSHAEIDWKAPGPHALPMKIEAGELTYKEAESVVWLNEGARLTRQNTVVNAASSIVHLEDGAIRQVDALKAEGVDQYPKRKLEYAADVLGVTYSDAGQVDRVWGRQNARLVSTSEGSETSMTSDVVTLDFEPVNNESVLKKAVGEGNAKIESKPVGPPGVKLPETRVVRSQTIEVDMRAGGREIEQVLTLAPGELDFLPNQPVQRPRKLNAERMTMIYGPSNKLQFFRAVNVTTETEPNAEERVKKQVVSKTRSKNMSAEFDPQTGQMRRMEQWDDFAYEEGDRKARANLAIMEAERNRMTLDKDARVWDAMGSTSADRIRMDQKSGDFMAEGHVNSSRLPDKKTSPSGMLSGEQPMEAIAERMNAANHNRLLHYEGHVVMWQGADRITAERVDIDREKRILQAAGGVVTQFLEKQQGEGEKSGGASAAFIVVKAANLVYTEQDRLAHYTGAVLLNRPLLQVKADDLQAFLS